MLKTGSMAPDMVLEDTDGQPVRLSDYRDIHSVLVFFMRSVSCAVCNMHIKDLTKRVDEFDAVNMKVLVAVPEDRQEAARWKDKKGVPFPVVTGRRGSPHESVGLARKVFGSMQQSGSILVDSRGVIRHAHGATMPTGSYDRRGIAAAVEDLRPPVPG